MIRSRFLLTSLLVLTITFAAQADDEHAEPIWASAGDGYLSLTVDEGHIRIQVHDADKRPVAVAEGKGTGFLTYVEDGHESKIDLVLDAETSTFEAEVPEGAHGPTKAVIKVSADGLSLQASFEIPDLDGHEGSHDHGGSH